MITVPTTPFAEQKPGTSGLRKKVAVMARPHYVENFLQAIFNSVSDTGSGLLVVGGDGRYYNREVIRKVVSIAAANGVRRLIIGRDGLLSTPAVSNLIRREGAFGGIILSASHNPGGPEGDFGIKFNAANGGPAPQAMTDAIYSETLALARYRVAETPEIDLSRTGRVEIGGMSVEIVDPVAAYAELMESLFDFRTISELFATGFSMCFDAMNAVTGPYAVEIFQNRLGAAPGSVINEEPMEDFGGGHPDPNPVHARKLFDRMMSAGAPDFGAASDGDGDRNLILGRGVFVTPSDSLAILAANATLVPAHSGGLKGIARSMPTSRAADRVAEKLGIAIFETPTGWKYFGNLLDAGKVSICGEESAGTGADHVREKDGLWAVLFWLNILACRRKSVVDIVSEHWREYGRNYYARWDYEGLEDRVAEKIFDTLRAAVANPPSSGSEAAAVKRADDFSYRDPVDGSLAVGQGLRFFLGDGSRIVFRLSGTGTAGATMRIYIERYEAPDGQIGLENAEALSWIGKLAVEMAGIEKFSGMSAPTVIT